MKKILMITILLNTQLMAQEVVESKNTTQKRSLQVILPDENEMSTPNLNNDTNKIPESLYQQNLISDEEAQSKEKNKEEVDPIKTIPPQERGVVSERTGYYPEWSFWYIKGGTSIVKYQNESIESTNTSIGHRVFSNSLYYGFEYNTIFKKNNFNVTNYLFTGGWHPNWKHKFTPYIGLALGASTFEDKQTNLEASGFITSLDLGMRITRMLPFHVYTGTRYGKATYDNNELESMNHQNFYVLFAVEF